MSKKAYAVATPFDVAEQSGKFKLRTTPSDLPCKGPAVLPSQKKLIKSISIQFKQVG